MRPSSGNHINEISKVSRGAPKKLKFFCNICQKQYSNENSYNNHCTSDEHRKRLKIFLEDADDVVSANNKKFTEMFLGILSDHYNYGQDVLANEIYQILIKNPSAVHLSSTRWTTLSGFISYCLRNGLIEANESALGWIVRRKSSTCPHNDKKDPEREKNEEIRKKLLDCQLASCKTALSTEADFLKQKIKVKLDKEENEEEEEEEEERDKGEHFPQEVIDMASTSKPKSLSLPKKLTKGVSLKRKR